jgi:hypothetical protein
MVVRSGVGRAIWLVFLLMTVNSCALTESLTQSLAGDKQGPEVSYAKPPVTYIREFPGYASQPVGTVYQGEEVVLLSRLKDNDWRRVQNSAGRRGWIQGALLSPVPLRVETYYVQAEAVPLRQEPHEEVISRQFLGRGAEVRKLAENDQGWWRVLVEKDKSLGWLPAETLGPYPPKKSLVGAAGRPAGTETVSSSQPAPKQFFVAANNLELRLLPLAGSEVVKILQFNDKVEEVYRYGSQWLKVKYPETGVQGWTLASYLSDSAVKAPKSAVGEKKKAPARPSRRDLRKKPIMPEELEPEIM